MRMAEPTRQCLLPTALVAVIVLGGATVMLHTQSELSRQSAEVRNRYPFDSRATRARG